MRAFERDVASGAFVDLSGGALSAWVTAARHLDSGRTQDALDVAAGRNASGVVLGPLAQLLGAGRVDGAKAASQSMPAVNCSAADASFIAALTSRDLASIAARADLCRSHGRTARAALLGLVDREIRSASPGRRPSQPAFSGGDAGAAPEGAAPARAPSCP